MKVLIFCMWHLFAEIGPRSTRSRHLQALKQASASQEEMAEEPDHYRQQRHGQSDQQHAYSVNPSLDSPWQREEVVEFSESEGIETNHDEEGTHLVVNFADDVGHHPAA